MCHLFDKKLLKRAHTETPLVFRTSGEPRRTKNSAVPIEQEVKGYGSSELCPNCILYNLKQLGD